ncbi:MAG: hypothetical protein EHM78_09605 [Myxococcaceae bacterium]|nr:MAG: hypothetical protein EHM78_09605 [Myxococcaceae bacterium]
MSPVTRARARPAGRRAAVEKKRGRYHHGNLLTALEVSVPPLEQLVAIFNTLLIEGARPRE